MEVLVLFQIILVTLLGCHAVVANSSSEVIGLAVGGSMVLLVSAVHLLDISDLVDAATPTPIVDKAKVVLLWQIYLAGDGLDILLILS